MKHIAMILGGIQIGIIGGIGLAALAIGVCYEFSFLHHAAATYWLPSYDAAMADFKHAHHDEARSIQFFVGLALIVIHFGAAIGGFIPFINWCDGKAEKGNKT